tara:strand:- start:862 stop:1224 length:363 start_codon:yes stop_codon:yes gene_type:complete
LTRILIFYIDLFARHAAILLRLGEEEEVLWSTLHAVEVVIHVEETNDDGDGANDPVVHLAGGPHVEKGQNDQYDLDESHFGHLGHLETLLDGFNLGGGFGGWVHVFTLAVSGHFYYIRRK